MTVSGQGLPVTSVQFDIGCTPIQLTDLLHSRDRPGDKGSHDVTRRQPGL